MARKPAGKEKKMGWLTVSCPANTQGQLTCADVEDAISILPIDLTDESREGGAVEGVPTNPRLVDDSIQSGPWFFGFENHGSRCRSLRPQMANPSLTQRTAPPSCAT